MKSTYTEHISLKDFYKQYVIICNKKKIKPKAYNEYSKLLRDFNLKVRDKIIYKAETFKMPYRLGSLYVKKFEVNYDLDNKKIWKIDFKKSKELGHIVYYGSPYGYKWQWIKTECIVPGKKYYNFKSCRKASRLIADAIKNKKIDYYS